MNEDHAAAERLWIRISTELRRERRRRRTKAIVLGLGGILGASIFLWPRESTSPRATPLAVAATPVPEAPAPTLAVVVWRDGTPRLEEVGGEDLGELDLQFSLEPVVARVDWTE